METDVEGPPIEKESDSVYLAENELPLIKNPNGRSPQREEITSQAPPPKFDSMEIDAIPREASSKQKQLRVKTRMELPMIIRGSTIISRPDSGSEENIIVADLASRLSLEADTSPEHQKEFRMASGKMVKALGRIIMSCAFARDPTIQLCCVFYIFSSLISPLIMGMSFLKETETLSRNRHRLQAQSSPSAGPLQLCSLNSPRCRLYCVANGEPSLANADTGSEIDLLSLSYVQKRRFQMKKVDLQTSAVQFADGSTSLLIGKVEILTILGTPEGPRLMTTFYVLDDLTCDILLGEDFLNDTAAFESYRDAFSLAEEDSDDACDVNTIVWFHTEWNPFRRDARHDTADSTHGKSKVP